MCEVRYALYYTPLVHSPLGQFGASWLAQDKQFTITKVARRYGFHGTLKAPFFMVNGIGFDVLDDALNSFCAHHSVFEVPPLKLSVLDGFVALRPEKKAISLHDFAANCVRSFDHFRRPPTAFELSKRLKADLTDRQKHHVDKWGYPYVMEDFCFHITLTDQLDLLDQERILKVLDHLTKDVLGNTPWMFDRVTLVRQKNMQATFEVVKEYQLGTTRGAKTV